MSGEGGIRTPDAGITDVTVFETAAFNHSATSPWQSVSTRPRPFNHLSPNRDHVPQSCTSISSLCRQPGSARFPPTDLDPQSRYLETKELEIGVFCAVL